MCVCADPMRFLSRLGQCLVPTNPSLTTNHSKCQTGSRMRTRPFIPDTRHRPSTARVSPSALHRISVSVLFRFYISYFRFGFGFIISARQRTLTNADERTIHIRQFHTPTCSIQGRSLWPTLNRQIRWGCVTVTHPIISDSLLYTPAIQVGQSDLPPSSNTNQRCRG